MEGVRNLNEAVRCGWHICSFLYTRENRLSGWAEEMLRSVRTDCNFELTAAQMADLSGKEDTSELVAVVRMREDSFSQFHFSENPIVALFDRPSNKGNLGTILRSCDALGVEGLILTGHGVDLYDPDVIISSMGSFFKVPAIRVADNAAVMDFIGKMKERYPGFLVAGTTAHRQHPLYELDLSGPVMFLIGNETEGLCRAFKEGCDVLTTIPMAEDSSASSFNVGCAATVMFYEAVRQRLKRPE